MTTIDLRNDDWALVAEALESEIEHINDLAKELDGIGDDESLRIERSKQARMEAIREYILSAAYTPA